jgi:transposase
MAGPDHQGIIVGVDTHLDIHVAVAIDTSGRTLGTTSVPSDTGGYVKLLRWAQEIGSLDRFGIEGTGTYGSGLAKYLAQHGVTVIEVDRPDRSARRCKGKTDAVDAEIAARKVLSGALQTRPKGGDGPVECLRLLRVARRSALKARTQAANQLRCLVVTSPDRIRAEVRHLSVARLVAVACAWRPGRPSDPDAASKVALRFVARRYRALTAEIEELDHEIRTLVEIAALAALALLALPNVGPETAAAFLIAAGDNPQRLKSDSSFAHLCGVAPRQASSGKTHRHRLDRGGDRAANSALYTITLGLMYRDERTAAYVARRTTEGLSKREIIRCLKRFVAREVFRTLVSCSASVPC